MDDRAVLRSVDLELVPGITVLRGPNGAGKTTALRALAGLVPLARGTREVPFDVLYIGHRPQLLHGLTPRESLRFFLEFRGPTSRAWATPVKPTAREMREDRIRAACDRWGLGEEADRPIERLSAGQRRRSALARLDLETCAATLLDEPFADLDETGAALLWSWLVDARALGIAVLVASHGHAELDRLAVRTYALADGRIAA
jgi:ABC-type multidrug transport system ATPase subunit